MTLEGVSFVEKVLWVLAVSTFSGAIANTLLLWRAR